MWTIHILKKWIKTSKMMIFQPSDSSLGWQVARAFPSSSGCRRDAPRPGRPSIARSLTPTRTHAAWDNVPLMSASLGHGGGTGSWEKTPHTRGQHADSAQTSAPRGTGVSFCQCYDAAMPNETMLLEGLLSVRKWHLAHSFTLGDDTVAVNAKRVERMAVHLNARSTAPWFR